MMHPMPVAWSPVLLAVLAISSASAASDAAAPIGEPVPGPATLHSMGVHWVIGGDQNQNAEVRVAWRAVGGTLMFLSHLVFASNVWTMRPRVGAPGVVVS